LIIQRKILENNPQKNAGQNVNSFLYYSGIDLNCECLWSCWELEVRRREVSPEKPMNRQVEEEGEGVEDENKLFKMHE